MQEWLLDNSIGAYFWKVIGLVLFASVAGGIIAIAKVRQERAKRHRETRRTKTARRDTLGRERQPRPPKQEIRKAVGGPRAISKLAKYALQPDCILTKAWRHASEKIGKINKFQPRDLIWGDLVKIIRSLAVPGEGFRNEDARLMRLAWEEFGRSDLSQCKLAEVIDVMEEMASDTTLGATRVLAEHGSSDRLLLSRIYIEFADGVAPLVPDTDGGRETRLKELKEEIRSSAITREDIERQGQRIVKEAEELLEKFNSDEVLRVQRGVLGINESCSLGECRA